MQLKRVYSGDPGGSETVTTGTVSSRKRLRLRSLSTSTGTSVSSAPVKQTELQILSAAGESGRNLSRSLVQSVAKINSMNAQVNIK